MARSKLTWLILLLASLFVVLAFTMLTARAEFSQATLTIKEGEVGGVSFVNLENASVGLDLQNISWPLSDLPLVIDPQSVGALQTKMITVYFVALTPQQKASVPNGRYAVKLVAGDQDTVLLYLVVENSSSLASAQDNRVDNLELKIAALELELDYWENQTSLLDNQNQGLRENDRAAQGKIDSLTSAIVDLKAKQRAMNEESHQMENRLRDEAKQNSDRLNSAFADMVKKLKAENENLVAQAQQWTLIAIGVAVGIPVVWLLKKKGKLRFKFRIPFSTPGPTDVPELDRVECAKNLLLSKGISVGEPSPPSETKKEEKPRPTGSKRARK